LSAEGEMLHEREGRSSSETVAGYLSAIAIFVAVIGVAWHPLRLVLPATLIALVAAAMAGPGRRLQFAAVVICAFCFFLGLTVAVATSGALW
jgi:hypothetical protein